jgi:hypothetical protein
MGSLPERRCRAARGNNHGPWSMVAWELACELARLTFQHYSVQVELPTVGRITHKNYFPRPAFLGLGRIIDRFTVFLELGRKHSATLRRRQTKEAAHAQPKAAARHSYSTQPFAFGPKTASSRLPWVHRADLERQQKDRKPKFKLAPYPVSHLLERRASWGPPRAPRLARASPRPYGCAEDFKRGRSQWRRTS